MAEQETAGHTIGKEEKHRERSRHRRSSRGRMRGHFLAVQEWGAEN